MPPRNPPNPALHPFDPGEETVIDWAVTAPVVFAVPTARAHCPTTSADGDADWLEVYVVVDARVTTTELVLLVRGFVSSTVAEEPLTAVTWPLAAPNSPLRKRLAPDGRVPDPLVVEPRRGNVPPPGGDPPAENPPPGPAVQLPDTGWVTETVVAVIGSPKALVVDDDPEVGLPNAETQEPTVTDPAVAGTIWRKVVLGV